VKYSFLILFLFTSLVFATGQSNIRFKRLTTEEGEDIVGVQKFFKDSHGYIWMGSSAFDLLRFDGRNFRRYGQPQLQTDYFKSIRAWLIFEDLKKNLWIGTDAGALMRYDEKLDRFQVVNDSSTSIKSLLFCQVEDKNGNFWIGSLGGGLIRYHPETKEFTHFKAEANNSETLPDNFITGLVLDSSGLLWISTTGGLCSYNLQTNQFERHLLTNNNSKDTYRYRVIRSMTLSTDNKLYLSTYGGLQIFDPATRTSNHLIHNDADPNSLGHNSLFQAVENPDSTFWIASYGGGLIHYNPSTNKFTSTIKDESNTESISSNNVFTVYLDSEGLLWAGTDDNTISVFNTKAKKFHIVTSKSNIPYGISSGWVHDLFQENDSILWLGLNGNGLNRLNLNTGVAEKFMNNPKDAFSLGHNAVMAIDQDKQKRIWVGLAGGGLNRLDRNTNKFTRFESGGKNSINNNAVSAMLVDKDNLIWVTTFRGGLSIYNIDQNKFINLTDDSLKEKLGISFAKTNDIFELDGNIWFKSNEQLVVFDKVYNRFVKIAYTDGAVSPTTTASFLEMQPYSSTEMLLFTRDEVKTIRYFNPDSVVQRLVQKRIKDDELFRSFVIDRQNQVWYNTTDRLVKWDLTSGDRRVYSKSDGIIASSLNSIFLDKQGRIFLSTLNGFNWFFPDEIKDDTVSRKIVFTDFKIYNKSVPIQNSDSLTSYTLPAHVSQTETIDLDYNHTFFSIEFTAMEFMAQDKIQYAYKLIGFDQDWIHVGNRNFASYTNLDPGQYTFQVKATNPDGYWGSQIKTLRITINPPFWQTSWFIGLSILLLASIAYAGHLYRLEQSLKVERLRNKIASDLHDEIGSSLTRISLYSDLLQTDPDQKERRNYLLTIRDLSREIVSTMSDIVWSIDNKNDSMGALIIRIKDFATELLYPKNIALDFAITNVDESRLLDPILKQNIYLICKEALNNVVKHAQATHVKVSLTSTSDSFTIRIEDNGLGYKDDAHVGNGIRNMKRRAQAIGGEFDIEHDKGTKITIQRKTI
jgi:signal transduction histidine kinase/ligand-binding sensor domain-containing protein